MCSNFYNNIVSESTKLSKNSILLQGFMRRDKNDEKWQEAKRRCYELDKSQCLLCQCMTVKEVILFEKNESGFSTSKIDPAHHLPVSLRPDLMYNADENIFCLCRAHHEALDHGRDPITGDFCTPDVTEKYWQRIIAKRKENLGQSTVELPSLFYDREEKSEAAKTSELSFDGLFYEDLD